MADGPRFVQATFRTNVNAGILVLPSGASTGIDADLEGMIAVGNGAGTSAVNGVRMQIKRSDTPAPARFGARGYRDERGPQHRQGQAPPATTEPACSRSTRVLQISNSDISRNTTRSTKAWISFGKSERSATPTPARRRPRPAVRPATSARSGGRQQTPIQRSASVHPRRSGISTDLARQQCPERSGRFLTVNLLQILASN
jgi:hypothetical protein